MTEEKLVKLLDMALEKITELEEENARKDKALADLSSGLEVQEAAIFELKDHNERLINSKGEGKPKWIDILDATKRPKANEQVLITTKIGKVTIACFDEDGKVHTQIGNKAVQALAWMPMPKVYDTERA